MPCRSPTGILGPEFPSLLVLWWVWPLWFLLPAWILTPKTTGILRQRTNGPANGWVLLKSRWTASDRIALPVWKAWVPYILVAGISVLSRVNEPFKKMLKDVVWKAVTFWASEVAASLDPLVLPGGILVFVVLLTVFLHKMSFKELKAAVGVSTQVLFGAGFVLMFTIPMVRIMMNSGVNLSRLRQHADCTR